ncbi:MAG: hypothetical protein WBE10_12595, partial [Candidatus Acidiferrum sp.]
ITERPALLLVTRSRHLEGVPPPLEVGHGFRKLLRRQEPAKTGTSDGTGLFLLSSRETKMENQ